MENFAGQIFNLLTTPPGNLVYHLILAFSVVSALQAALVVRPRSGRLLMGLSIILLAQLVLFASSGLAWQQLADPQRLLPPLDRAIFAITLAWIIWLWCYPVSNRLADSAILLLTIILGVLAAFTASAWLQMPGGQAFNASTYDRTWQIFSLVILFIGILALLLNHPPAWGTGLIALGLLLAGYVTNLLVQTPDGDFSGILRLSHLCAFPLLPVLAQRISAAQPSQPVAPRIEPEPARPTLDPNSAQIWLQLAAETEPQKIANLLARAIARVYKADLAFIVTSPNGLGRWQLKGGYDLISDEPLEDLSLDAARVPLLTEALQRGRAIRLETEPKLSDDLLAVANFLGLDDPGSLLAAPLITSGTVWGAIVLFAPYSHPAWSDRERDLLAANTDAFMEILQRGSPSAPQSAPPTNGYITQLENELQAAHQQLDTLRRETPAGHSAPEIEALLAVQRESQETIARLKAENEHLSSARATLLFTSAADADYTRQELQMALEDVAFTHNQLAEANTRILALERDKASGSVSHAQDWVTVATQDMYQPLTAVSGYCDLLMSGAAGTLNADQHAYLERVKSATERLRAIVDDLLRIVPMANGSLQLRLTRVDLNAVVNQAVSANAALLREKNISLQTHLDDELPTPNANHKALCQVVTNLLRAAATSTPAGSTIGLRVTCDNQNTILIQVTDSGAGIPDEQIEQMFEPDFQSGNVQVEGAGEGSLVLPIARALVLAQGGEIQVESRTNFGTIYSVHLPLDNGSADAPNPA